MTTDLIKKLEALTGPVTASRDLEKIIRLSPFYSKTPSSDPLWPIFVRAIGGSVDAAIALAELVLTPYSLFALMSQAFTWMHCRYPMKDHAKILPIALCIAILKALNASPLAGDKRGAE